MNMRKFTIRVDLTVDETAAVMVAITDKVRELDALLKATQETVETEKDVKYMKALSKSLYAALEKIIDGAVKA